MRVLVTGASGFVGATLVEYFSKITDVSVVAMVRSTRMFASMQTLNSGLQKFVQRGK